MGTTVSTTEPGTGAPQQQQEDARMPDAAAPSPSPASTPPPAAKRRVWKWSERAHAISCAQHPRLGASSPASLMSSDVLRHICSLARPPIVVTGSWDKTVRVWDAERLVCSGTLRGHTGPVRCVAATETHIVSGSHDTTLRVWRRDNGTCERVLSGHRHWVLCVQVLPTSGLIVSGSRDKTIAVWSSATGALMESFTAHDWAVWSLAATPDESTVISGGGDHSIKVWSAATWKPAMPDLIGHTGPVQYLRVGGAGGSGQGERMLASCGGAGDHTVRLWDLSNGTCLRTLAGHTGIVWGVQLAQRASMLAVVTASDDGSVREWDAATGKCTRELTPPKATGHVYGVLISEGRDIDLGNAWGEEESGAAFATAASIPGSNAQQKQLQQQQHQPQHQGESKGKEEAADEEEDFDGEGGDGVGVRMMVTASADRSVVVWKYPSCHVVKQLTGHTEAISSICVPEMGLPI